MAMREEALRLENAARAKATLEQFYRQRDEVNRKRAVLNRYESVVTRLVGRLLSLTMWVG